MDAPMKDKEASYISVKCKHCGQEFIVKKGHVIEYVLDEFNNRWIHAQVGVQVNGKDSPGG